MAVVSLDKNQNNALYSLLHPGNSHRLDQSALPLHALSKPLARIYQWVVVLHMSNHSIRVRNVQLSDPRVRGYRSDSFMNNIATIATNLHMSPPLSPQSPQVAPLSPQISPLSPQIHRHYRHYFVLHSDQKKTLSLDGILNKFKQVLTTE